MSLFNQFTILAIFVSCLGLYGLVALIPVQRTKEIGIRKVLGATLRHLFSIKAKDFMKLVFWSLLIALPIAAVVMNQWLLNYCTGRDQPGSYKNRIGKSGEKFEGGMGRRSFASYLYRISSIPYA